MTTEYDVIVGLEVGKTAHHGYARTATGERLHDKELPQEETALTTVTEQLQAHGDLLVVDQPKPSARCRSPWREHVMPP